MNKISFSRYRISSVFILQRETRREREQESVMENKRAIFLFIYLSGPSWPCRALTLCVMVRHQPNPSPFKKTILWLYSICLLQIWFYYEPRPHLFPAWLMSMHRPVLTLSLAHFSPLLFTLKLIDCLIRHLAAHGEFGYLYSSLEGSSSFPLLNISSRWKCINTHNSSRSPHLWARTVWPLLNYTLTGFVCSPDQQISSFGISVMAYYTEIMHRIPINHVRVCVCVLI